MTDTEISLLAKAIAKELYENGIELTADYREVVMERNHALVELADAQARLAGYEVGFDPKVKLPKDRQTVIAKEVRDDQPIYWDVEFLNGDDGNLWVNWAFAEPSNTADIVRWFPLPGSKEDE